MVILMIVVITVVVHSHRAAHDWAVKAMAKDSSLGVEVIGTSFSPGQDLVQVQVGSSAKPKSQQDASSTSCASVSS